jgi:peptidoglycan/LPS O-acetylase OafA/YrhL
VPAAKRTEELHARDLNDLPNQQKRRRLDSVDLVRGLASLAVVLFHFFKGYFSDDHILRQVTGFGWLGVEAFFVVSGFVIPLSMHYSRFELSCIHRFMAKRWIRLSPPYLISVVVVVLLWKASTLAPGFTGVPFTLTLCDLISHFFYANDFIGQPWLNPVYWTLAIELQYYFIIALAFPLFFSKRASLRVLAAVLAFSIGLFGWPQSIVLKWTFVFWAGIAVAQYRTKTFLQHEALVTASLVMFGTYYCNGLQIFVVTLATTCLILFVQTVPYFLRWLGCVSYSLYLLHVPIGGRVINLSKRFVSNDVERFGVILLATAVSLLSAWAFYRLVEVPAHQLSRRIKMKSKLLTESEPAK